MTKSQIKTELTAIVSASPSYEIALHGISQFFVKNAQLGIIDDFVDIAISVLTNKFGVTE